MRLSLPFGFAALLAIVIGACSTTVLKTEAAPGTPDPLLPEEDPEAEPDGGRADAASATDGRGPTPGCVPKTCATLGADCGSVPDGCDGTITCGVCKGALTCGGGGSANRCGRPSFVFSSVASGTTANLTGISGSSVTDLWAVGSNGFAMHWDGVAWTPSSTGTAHNGTVSVTPTRTLVGAQLGRVLERNGATWSVLVAEDAQSDFESVWDGGSEFWAVGQLWNGNGAPGHMVHGAGGTTTGSTAAEALTSVWGTSPSNVWAGGFHGALAHWDGSGWTWGQLPATNNTIVGLWGRDTDDVWAVTPNSVVGRYNGISWSVGGASPGLWAVHGTSSSDVWMVGAAGLVRHFDGASWTSIPTGTTAHLSSVWASAKEVWAVGFGGTLLRGRLVGSDPCWPNTACTASHRNACSMIDGTPHCACTAGYPQVGGACVAVCVASCAGKQCGSDGCGGSCGGCAGGGACLPSGQCPACVPQCAGKACGNDGCGGSCGMCGAAKTCNASSQCVLAGPCDPVANVGCAAPNQCITLANQSNQCVLMGVGVQGSPCADSASCQGGYGCFAGTCRKICDRLMRVGCAFDESCAAVVGWNRYGTCAP